MLSIAKWCGSANFISLTSILLLQLTHSPDIMFFILFLLAVNSVTIVDGSTTSGDSAALLSLKNGAGDPLGRLSGWNKSVNCCKWEGVDCSAQQGRVIGLSLQFLTLSSPNLLFSTIHNLSHLRELHITRSQFTEGPLSSKLSRLSSCALEVLDLSNNNLYGSFPTQLALLDCKSSLRQLNLSHNQLGGELGSNYVIGSTLEAIDLSNNNFNGTISSSLFKSCDSLRSFNLSNNGFAGSVPQEMVTHCPVLEDVGLAGNNFSGALDFSNSSSIRRINLASNSLIEIAITCRNVTHLDVAYNKLSGRIFSSSNLTCSSLKVLNISSNFFSGPLPSVLGLTNLQLHSSLEVLDASYNSFTDEVPEFHANLKHLDLSSNKFTKTRSNSSICPTGSKLESLILPNNRLAGPLFNSLMNCGSLEMLDLSFNALTGEIPDQLCRSLPKLRQLLAWGNGLQGAIPSTLVNCINMTTIILSHNNLNGSIPPQLSGLRKLWWLSLSSNSLSGQIPSSFGELHNLVFLQLNNNSLEGDIPREMDGSKALYVIELASNLLTGKFPATIGHKEQVTEGTPVEDRYGSLRIARTSGPVCIGSNFLFLVQGIHLPDLVELLSARTGCFAQLNFCPTFLWNIRSLLLLGLSYNQLSGEIPEEVGLMSSLLVLVVAHNKFSGPIPAALGNLKGSQVLDLSQNALTGRLPASLSQLASLNVSYNNLSGPIPQNGQFLSFSYQGNPLLCGLPLPTKCSAAGLPIVPNPDGLQNTTHRVSDGEIQDIVVAALVSGSIAFLISFTLTLFCNRCPKLK